MRSQIRTRLWVGSASARARCWQPTHLSRRFSVQPSFARRSSRLGWVALGALVVGLVIAAALRDENAGKIRWMSVLSGLLGVLMVVQTLAWIVALAR